MYAVLPNAESQDPAAMEPATPQRVVAMHMDNSYLVIITTVGVQIWAGGRNRLKIGELVRDQASLLECGPNIAGLWSPSRRQIATLVRVWECLQCLHAFDTFDHVSDGQRLSDDLWHEVIADIGAASRRRWSTLLAPRHPRRGCASADLCACGAH